MTEQTERPTTVHVDVVEPGRAVIVANGHQARVGRDGGRFYVEDADTERVIGHARSYRATGELFARHHGIVNPTIEVDREI